jgi:hypothetical protein
MADSEPPPYRQEKFFFKRMAWGWVFRSPISWWPLGLGPRRCYLLNEAQKAKIVRTMFEMGWRRRTLRLAALLLGAVPLHVLYWKSLSMWMGYGLPLELYIVTFVLFLAVCEQIILNLLYRQALRPILAGASRTNDRIAFIERLAHMRTPRLLQPGFWAACCVPPYSDCLPMSRWYRKLHFLAPSA